MPQHQNTLQSGPPSQANLKVYVAELPFSGFSVGVDNIHHDIYLSPKWTEQTRVYLLELIRKNANLTYAIRTGPAQTESQAP